MLKVLLKYLHSVCLTLKKNLFLISVSEPNQYFLKYLCPRVTQQKNQFFGNFSNYSRIFFKIFRKCPRVAQDNEQIIEIVLSQPESRSNSFFTDYRGTRKQNIAKNKFIAHFQ